MAPIDWVLSIIAWLKIEKIAKKRTHHSIYSITNRAPNPRRHRPLRLLQYHFLAPPLIRIQLVRPHRFIRIITCLFIVSLVACSNSPKTNQDIFNEITRATDVSYTNDAEKSLAEAETTLRKAQQEKLDFYAPSTFLSIEANIRDARQAHIEANALRIQQANEQSTQQLQDGLRIKSNVQQQLQQPLQHKQALDRIKAGNVSTTQYQAIIQQLQHSIQQIEQGITVKSSDIDYLIAQMQILEMETVLTVYWRPAERALAQAKAEQAEQFAPKTYSNANITVSNAEMDIRTHYQDLAMVADMGQTALRSAQQALFVARESRLLVNATPSSAETFVLRIQGYLFDIAQTVHGLEVRHLSLQDQALAIQQRLREALQSKP